MKLPMKISSLLLLIFSINLVACLGDEAPDTPEPTQTAIIINEQEVGSAIEDCEKPLANYSNFQQVYNDCTSWDEDMGILEVKYRSDNASSTGFGLRVHFDSTALSFDKLSYNFPTDYIGFGGPDNDVDDLDNDAITDKYITVAWASLLGNWPGENTTNQITNYAEITLVNIDFNRVDNSTENYVINYTPSSSAAGVNLILGR
jgi:hypothetical protein